MSPAQQEWLAAARAAMQIEADAVARAGCRLDGELIRAVDLILAHPGKIVVTGTTFARVSYDIPGQEQRYARVRGLRDAELRAARVVADNIRLRLSSYFIAGT